MTNKTYTPSDSEFENMIEWSYEYNTKEELTNWLKEEGWNTESINELINDHRKDIK